jgi:two-component system CheB/CheR fusion protein
LTSPALHEFLDSIQARGTTTNDYEIDVELPNLGRRSFLMSARVLRVEPLAKRKILVAIVDFTEAKREGRALKTAKSEAEKANVGKSRFLAAASHDLRQPLQTISLLQGMLEKCVHDQATLKLVHRLDETVSTMSNMLDKLLDINQLEAGIVRPAVVDFSIKTLLDEMRAEFAYHAAANSLDWRVVPSSLIARTDPRLLEQIIRNLLSNAVKYTTACKLLLGCRRSGDRPRIEVWDTGPGIPEMELQAIFEEFHQLDNPARQRSKGLGLGLAIVQRLADLLGHKIDVRSRLGAGSVFTIEVLLGRVEATGPPVLGHAEIPENVPARGTILIVDDDPVVLDMLRLLFDDQGQRTIVAADGHQALEFTEGSNMPDPIVADYNLPNGITGLEIIARLQARAQHPIPPLF